MVSNILILLVSESYSKMNFWIVLKKNTITLIAIHEAQLFRMLDLKNHRNILNSLRRHINETPLKEFI